MSNYDIIEYGYNRNDETINFGTRCLAEGDNLYETCTLAILKSSEDDTESPSENSIPFLNAIIKNSNVYFSVNNCLRVFDDKECTNVSLNAPFGNIIDTFSISEDGSYIFVGLRNGSIRVLNVVGENTECIYSVDLSENVWTDAFFIASFLEYHDDISVEFLVISRKGQVYRITINLDKHIETDYVSSEEIFDARSLVKVAAFNCPCLLLNGAELTLLDTETREIQSDKSYNFHKLCSLGSMFCGLESSGQLIKICSTTLLSFPVHTEQSYVDMIAVSDSYDTPKHLMTVTAKVDEVAHVECLSYPDLSKIYSIKLQTDIIFITPESVNDEAMYISKVTEQEKFTELRFHMIYEAEPEKRLFRLLRKGKFDEAESFAKMFNVDPMIIKKARAQAIEDKMICEREDIDKLLEIVSTITDDEFKMQTCINIHCCCSEYNDVKRILHYGCKIIPSKKGAEFMANIADLQSTLSQLMFRFDIFSAIYGKENYSMGLWTRFSGECLLEEVKSHLRAFKIDDAIITYSHLDEFAIAKLNHSSIDEILSILNELPVNVYQPFLPTFIPITLSYIPEVLPVFVEWLHNKIFRLEKKEKADFPDNGIKFAENIINLLKVHTDNLMSFQRECYLQRDNLKKLGNLLHSLKGIQTLRNNFRISIPLAKYLMGPKPVIGFLLNVNLSSEECDILFKEFLCPLIYEHHLDPDEVLLEEIKNLMRFKETYWINTIRVVLKYINTLGAKLKAMEVILESAQVPWSDMVRKIANDALQYSHPKVTLIKELIEDEPMLIVLRKPKYKFRQKRINTLDDFIFTVDRIIYCNDDNMVEDIYKLCKIKEHRHEANLLLFKHFIRKEDSTKAFSILDNNTPDEVLNCARELCIFAEIHINNEVNIPNLQNSYHEILGSLHKRWIENTNDSNQKSIISGHLNLLRSVYTLRIFFNKNITSDCLSNNQYRIGLLKELISDLKTDFEENKCDIIKALTTCSKIASCLEIDKDEILIRLCETLADFKFVLEAARNLYMNCTNSRNLCLVAVSLLKYTGSLKILEDSSPTSADDSFETSSFQIQNLEDDCEQYTVGLTLAEKLVSKAMLYAYPDELLTCLEVAGWIGTGFYLIHNQQNSVQNILAKNLYIPASTSPGFIVFSSVQRVFTLYCNFIAQYNISDKKYLTYFTEENSMISEEDFIKELKTLPNLIENLCREGQQFTAYTLIIELQRALLLCPDQNPAISKILNNLLKAFCLAPLLRAVISSLYIDSHLLYDLLLCYDQSEAVKFILQNMRLYKRQPKKFASLASAGVRLLEYYKISDGRQVWKNSLLSVKWWQKLELEASKCMTYDNFFMMKPEERLEQLIMLNCADIAMIYEYCNDFSVEVQTYYLMFLKRTLLNWKPQYNIDTDIYGKRHLNIKSDADDLRKTCLDIISVINSREVVLETVSALWNQINFYHYEVFICALSIISSLKEKKSDKTLLMLMFLKNYERVSKPSQEEIEHWFTAFPTTQTLDVFSEFRLPFINALFTNDVWKIIRPELTLKTYTFWFSAINIVKILNKDDICSYVVKGIVSSGILQSTDGSEWVLHTKHDNLFAEIDDCMTNMGNLELATSVAYHLMTHTPRGADQVNAAEMCYRYALKYKNSVTLTPDVEKAFVKVQSKYFSFSAMHILYLHQLADEKYVQLVSNPKELVTALYEDERIIRKMESVDFQCPDINQAVESLAKLFVSVDIQKLKYDLINNWLADPTSGVLDITISGVLMKNLESIRNGNGQFSDDNLQRAAYLCSGGTMWSGYLFKAGVEGGEEQKTLYFRARALKCFCAISDIETIKLHSGLSYEEFQNFVDKLSLLSDLEYVGFTMDTDMLDQYNKKELLNRLAQHGSRNNTLHIKIMAKICITYCIFSTKYWEFIINSTIKLNMIAELKIYVNILKDKSLKYKSFYINAWQKIIDHSFMMSNIEGVENLDSIMMSNILLIQSCPILFTIKYESALKRCLELRKPAFAAILLQYLPEDKLSSYVEDILSANKTDIYKELNGLAIEGVWGVMKVKSMLQAAKNV